MARRLNTLLHDLKLRPGAALTTRDQLEALFRTEVERMGEHLDNLQFAARRIGSDPMLAVRADIEIGWVYRLIELFGATRRLGFDKGCPARQALERAGIPEHGIEVIAQTFVQKQAACRQVHFEKALLDDTERHGIADTLVNRERATAQLMRAKADMLLDSPSRYPEVEGLSVSALLGGTVAVDSRPEGTVTEESPAAMHTAAITTPDHNAAAPTSEEEPDTTAEAVEVQSGAAVGPDGDSPKGKRLPVSEFMGRCEKLIKSKRSWEDKAEADRIKADKAAARWKLEKKKAREKAKKAQVNAGRRSGLQDIANMLSSVTGGTAITNRIETAGSVGESAASPEPIVAIVPIMLPVMATVLMIQLQNFSRLLLVTRTDNAAGRAIGVFKEGPFPKRRFTAYVRQVLVPRRSRPATS